MSKCMQNFIKEVQVVVDEIQDEVLLTSKISIAMEPILNDPLLLTDEQLLVKKNMIEKGTKVGRFSISHCGSSI